MNEKGEFVPATERGRRTRARLMQAARTVFATKQYLDTNVADIVAAAKLAHGTFYRYFPSKEAIFREVALELQQEMMSGRHPLPDEHDGRDGHDDRDGHEAGDRDSITSAQRHLDSIERANRRYFEAYRRNAALMGVIEQVATFNEELRAIRREVRVAWVDRARRSIERMQAEGLVHYDIDAHYAANALGAMVDRFAYVWLVLGEPFDGDEAARTVTLLWARSLGLDVPEGALGRPGHLGSRLA